MTASGSTRFHCPADGCCDHGTIVAAGGKGTRPCTRCDAERRALAAIFTAHLTAAQRNGTHCLLCDRTPEHAKHAGDIDGVKVVICTPSCLGAAA